MQTETIQDAEYREYFDLGMKAGRDALGVLPQSEIDGLRVRVTRIANALETAWYDAAYARGFLKALEPRTWRQQPGVLRRRRARGWS
jgi:hypothetical protein